MVTTPCVPGYRVTRAIGATYGLLVRSRGLGRHLVAGFLSVAGGEIAEYAALLEPVRPDALRRLQDPARRPGQNAVLSVGFAGSDRSDSMAGVPARGTAAVVEPDPAPASRWPFARPTGRRKAQRGPSLRAMGAPVV